MELVSIIVPAYNRIDELVDAVKYLLPHTPATVACERLEDVYRFDGRKAGCLRDIGRDLKRSPTLSKYFEKYPQE